MFVISKLLKKKIGSNTTRGMRLKFSNIKYLLPSKKYAFLIHEPMMLNHYEAVWQAMGKAKFAIVLTEHFYTDLNGSEKEGVYSFLNHVRQRKYTIFDMADVINCGIIFDFVVTNHPISGGIKNVKKQERYDILKKLFNRILIFLGSKPRWCYNIDIETYLPLQIGKKQIRYMYGADLSDAWSLSEWNEIYDLFLCHGVNDEKLIKERFSGKTFIMGYPRYDEYFDCNIDLSSIKKEFDICKEKKTLVWMPTLGSCGSSIPYYAKLISLLNDDYNIIVRPHPLAFQQEMDSILELKKNNLKIDNNSTRNMNELFSLADLIIADYGGTLFSAIFLGKNIVLLDVPGADSLQINVRSSVLELKKHLPLYTQKNIHELPKFLNSHISLQENQKKVEFLFDKYFGTLRGGNSVQVARYLKTLKIK